MNRRAWLVINGISVLVIAAVLDWFLNIMVFGMAQDLGAWGVILAVFLVMVFIPVTYLNRYAIKVIKGNVQGIKALDDANISTTTVGLVILAFLMAAFLFGLKNMQEFAAGIPKESTYGFLGVLLVSYIAAWLIDFAKKHPFRK